MSKNYAITTFVNKKLTFALGTLLLNLKQYSVVQKDIIIFYDDLCEEDIKKYSLDES